MSVTFVTAIYSKLNDGSIGRWDRYTYSLKNLVNSTDANFIIFTSPEEETALYKFISTEKLDRNKILLVPRRLDQSPWHSDFEELKIKYPHGQRCMDLVHSKVSWLYEASTTNPFKTDSVFWIDAGLSFSGLFPSKFLRRPFNEYDNAFERYTDLNVFTSEWANAIDKSSGERIMSIGLSNKNFLWTQPLETSFYDNTSERGKFHIIGGLFGGSDKKSIQWFNSEYYNLLSKVLTLYKTDKTKLPTLPVEELLLTVLVSNNRDRFDIKLFDTWYHEDHEESFNQYKNGIPFYKLFTK